MSKRDKAHLITFGLGGHGMELSRVMRHGPESLAGMVPGTPAEYIQVSHLSGYEDPDSFLKRVNRGEYAEYEGMDGCPVRDGRAAFERRAGLAWREPMVDTRLKDDELSPSPKPSAIMAVVAPNWGAAGLELIRNAVREDAPAVDRLESIGGTDMVSVATYLAWWRKYGVPEGGRIGVLRRYNDDERIGVPKAHAADDEWYYEWEQQ